MKCTITIFGALLILLSLSTCRSFSDIDELEVPAYEPSFAFPIANSTLTITDILQEFEDISTILVDPDGQLRFHYRGDVITRNSQQVFGSINDALPPFIPVLQRQIALPLTLPGGVDLDRVDLKAGQLVYYFENAETVPLTVTLTIPQLVRQGQPLSIMLSAPAYSGTDPRPALTNALAPATLAGYQLIPQNDTVYFRYTALTPDGREVNLTNAVLRIADLAFSYAEGYLGQQLYRGGRDTISIDFFDRYLGGEIYFAEPKITFFFENSFGVPTRSRVNAFNVFTVDGRTLAVESDFVDRGIDFPYPGLNAIGQVARDSFVFTKDNSNIDILLGSGPVAVDYDVDAITNPDADVSQRGFITDSSFYRVQVEVDLPLAGRVNNYLVRDSFSLDLTKPQDAVSGRFKIVGENQLPLDVELQGYFLAPDGQVVDSLFSNGKQRVVAGAPVNNQGVAQGTQRQEVFVDFPEARFSPIRQAQLLIMEATFSTSSNTGKTVRINANQSFTVRAGVIVNLRK